MALIHRGADDLPKQDTGRVITTRHGTPDGTQAAALQLEGSAVSWSGPCSQHGMTRDRDELPKGLSGFRLFCMAFVLTFAGVMSNLAVFDLLTVYLNQQEVTRPSSDGPSSQPQLARLGTTHGVPGL